MAERSIREMEDRLRTQGLNPDDRADSHQPIRLHSRAESAPSSRVSPEAM